MNRRRPLQWGSGSVSKAQSRPVPNCCEKAAGMTTLMWRFFPPASTSVTVFEGSSESLAASAQPLDPAPTITKSEAAIT